MVLQNAWKPVFSRRRLGKETISSYRCARTTFFFIAVVVSDIFVFFLTRVLFFLFPLVAVM